jgi:hypothetical protein
LCFKHNARREEKVMSNQKDKYNDPIIITFPNMVARVYSPILDPEEREKRMKAIHRATADVLRNKMYN